MGIKSAYLKDTILTGTFDIADPSSMQDACHHEFPSSSVVSSSVGSIPEGDSVCFFLPCLRHSEHSIFSYFLSELKINHPSLFITLQIIFCSNFLWLSVLPRCRERRRLCGRTCMFRSSLFKLKTLPDNGRLRV